MNELINIVTSLQWSQKSVDSCYCFPGCVKEMLDIENRKKEQNVRSTVTSINQKS